jgi:hypothetical protein
VKPSESNIQGAGICSRCGWGIDVHPLDAEGVDVGRCLTADESIRLAAEPDLFESLLIIRDFPRAAR